jgi:hypothetical protein
VGYKEVMAASCILNFITLVNLNTCVLIPTLLKFFPILLIVTAQEEKGSRSVSIVKVEAKVYSTINRPN